MGGSSPCQGPNKINKPVWGKYSQLSNLYFSGWGRSGTLLWGMSNSLRQKPCARAGSGGAAG